MRSVNLADYVYYDETSPTMLRRSPNNLDIRHKYRAYQPIGQSTGGQGYKVVFIKGTTTAYVHRVVWELHNGPVPKGMVIDHIDRDKTNNRISNLRCVTQAVNNSNMHTQPNKHGFTGVYYDHRDRRYYAKITQTVNGKRKQILIGNYSTAKEAGAAYLAKKREFYPCSGAYEKLKKFEPGLASLLMFS